MANRISTEGCSKKWTQRRRKRDTNDKDDIDNLFTEILEDVQSGGESQKKRCASTNRAKTTFRHRPNDEGEVLRVTKPRRTKPTHCATGGRLNEHVPVDGLQLQVEQPPVVDPNDQLQELISDLVGEGYQVSAWENRQIEVEANWLAYRQHILNITLETEAPIGDDDGYQCFACGTEPAVLRCLDCTGSYLCMTCDSIIHTCNPMHDRQVFMNGFFNRFSQDNSFPINLITKFECYHCGSNVCLFEPSGCYIAVTLKGRFDLPKYRTRCDACKRLNPEFDLSNILHRGFFPGNPDTRKSDYIFEAKLLQMWHCIYRHLPGSSLSGFIGVLNDISTKFGRKPTINQTVFSKVVAEYAYMATELDVLKHRDNMKCPPCSIQQHSSHVDGNHKLYRYRSVARGPREPYYMDKFIVKDQTVTDHIEKVYEAHPQKRKGTFSDVYCGNSRWKAARETNHSNNKLDETGLVVCGCRHAIAQKAVNMFAGELYGYSHYLHIYFMVSNGVKYIFQDVMCKYWPWANKVGVTSNLWSTACDMTTPALSVFHAKAHSWHCQVMWGGRYVDGAGAGAGEDMEQAFSHLSRTGSTTKHMGPAARSDTITEHVLFWNGRKIDGLPDLLCKRYKQMKLDLEEVQLKMRLVCDDDLKTWKEDVAKAAREVNQTTGGSSTNRLLQQMFVLEEKQKTATALRSFVCSSNEGLSAIAGMGSLYDLAKQHLGHHLPTHKLQSIQEKLKQVFPTEDIQTLAKKAAISAAQNVLHADIELTCNAVRQRDQAIKALADTSKKRAAYRAKIDKDKAYIKKKLIKLHMVDCIEDPEAAMCSMGDILQGLFPWQIRGEASWSKKKAAVDTHMMHMRLREEEELLINEMKNFLQYYRNVQHILQQEISQIELEDQEDIQDDENEDDLPRYSVSKNISGRAKEGLISLKKRGIAEARAHINRGLTGFSKVTSDGFRDMVFEAEEDESDIEINEDREFEDELIIDVDNDS